MEYNDGDSSTLREWKINHEAALARHNLFFTQQAGLATSVISFGLEAIRTTALINGGAAIAVFAFLGALYGSENEASRRIIQALHPAAIYFSVGAIFSGMASGWAYFAQYKYLDGHNEATLHWDHPHVRHGEKSELAERWGMFWHALCVAFVVFSYAATALGLWNAWGAMNIAG